MGVQQAPYIRCLRFQVVCNLMQEEMYFLHLPTNCKLTVVDLLTPSTKFCKTFGDGGVSLRQGVLYFTPQMPKLGVCILGKCVDLLGVVCGLEEGVCLDVNREVIQVV